MIAGATSLLKHCEVIMLVDICGMQTRFWNKSISLTSEIIRSLKEEEKNCKKYRKKEQEEKIIELSEGNQN